MSTLEIVVLIIGGVEILNLFLLFTMIFLEKKKPQSIIAWMTILTFLPVIGFVFYMLMGSGLSIRTRQMIKRKKLSQKDLLKNFDWKDSLADFKSSPEIMQDKDFAYFCYNYGAYPCLYNNVKIYNNGFDKINALKKDLQSAQRSINIEYYIFSNDKTGKEIMDILIDKARLGVKVKLIYDSMGSREAPRRFFDQLRKAGGDVAEFFPPLMHFRAINLKINYRNHRKIVVIDGKVAYTGGINIRDDHMGLKKRLSPWRDTHIRIEGSGVFPLQNIFFNDWRYCVQEDKVTNDYVKEGYFTRPEKKGDVAVQVLECGPDSFNQQIEEAYIKLILNARKRIFIQTPYFVPSENIYKALKIAKKSGVDVRIMLPKKPDRKVVYLPTLSYAREMLDYGIKVYLYKGFLHSKTVIIDDNKLSIGTCNFDNRSFSLNFEDTVIMYSTKMNKQYTKQYLEDINNCVETDKEYFDTKPFRNKMAQSVYRLLSPLL